MYVYLRYICTYYSVLYSSGLTDTFTFVQLNVYYGKSKSSTDAAQGSNLTLNISGYKGSTEIYHLKSG